ncbi:MAG TPA: serine hydrolase domain-containing protein [Vicinamibacterales bacterium]|nr:serine hydrolase domain-containing protein [Vicinamibacterales bacterium]
MTGFPTAAALLADAVAERATPAVVVETGRAAGVLWREAFGRLTYDADAPPATTDTIFDLASLTKVLGTATLAMRAVDENRLRLEDPVRGHLSQWRGADRERVTIRDLLAHCSGLTTYLPFYRDHEGRVEFERSICTMPLEYAPRTRALYSDLGFILLGFILEDALGARLADAFEAVRPGLTTGPLCFNPAAPLKARAAPTEVDAWRGRLLKGEVHDENAWALGGAAGHAGLFGTAAAVGDFARLLLATFDADTALARRATLRAFTAKTTDVPGSSRALGWDTMVPTSSSGARLSRRAIGHTGFTGTSLWIDPELDLYVVLLTNTIHPTREDNRFKPLRGRIHDAIVGDLA